MGGVARDPGQALGMQEPGGKGPEQATDRGSELREYARCVRTQPTR